jgi:O-antigen ligase
MIANSSFKWSGLDRWRGRYTERLTRFADYFAIMMAIALPWSTTLFAIFAVAWAISLVPTVENAALGQLLKRPLCALPTALFVLAVVGMFWSQAPWGARIHAAGGLVKFLAVPLLVYQFQRSSSGLRIFGAFLGSCTVLMILSWLNWIDPRFALIPVRVVGVPVKNWITQGQEFVLCFFGAAACAVILWRSDRPLLSVLAGLLGLAFLLNLTFVVSSRTALISIGLLLPVLTIGYLKTRWALALLCMTVFVLGAVWFGSSYFRMRIDSIRDQYELYVERNELTSVGLRLEYWHKSIGYIERAPFIGNGTGSIRGLFEKDAIGKSLAPAAVTANPHNQTLYFGVEWGMLGIVLLISMWTSHFLAFTETRWISWIGMLVVSQNVFGSLLNSHLSDSVEGWLYVMGVGVAAGTILNTKIKVLWTRSASTAAAGPRA